MRASARAAVRLRGSAAGLLRRFDVHAALPGLPEALGALRAVLPLRDVRAHWAVLAFAAAAGPLLERYTTIGAKLSAVVVSLLAGMFFSNTGILPAESPAYDAVWSHLVPLAIPLLLLRADLKRLLFPPSASPAAPAAPGQTEERLGPVFKGYALGSLGVVIGCVMGTRIFRATDYWKLGAMYIATLVGGSMNFIAVAEALGVRGGDFLTAAIAADNLSMALYFLFLFQAHRVPFLKGLYGGAPEAGTQPQDPAPAPSAPAATEQLSLDPSEAYFLSFVLLIQFNLDLILLTSRLLRVPIALALPLAFSAAVCAASFAAQSALNAAGLFLKVI
eukprot:tig00020801_g13896.t1